MEQYIISKKDALAIVAGDKFYDFLYDEISQKVSSEFLISLGNKLGIKNNDLHNLNAEQLNILYNTLDKYKDDGKIEKAAFDNVITAIEKKISLFKSGDFDLWVEETSAMRNLIIKMMTNDQVENVNKYKTALNRIRVIEDRYDIENNLKDIDENDFSRIEKNIEKMQEWQQDVTHLDDFETERFSVIPDNQLLDYVKRYISEDENTSFTSYASALMSSAQRPELKTVIVKAIEKRLHKLLNTNEKIPQYDIEAAYYVLENSYDVKSKKSNKLWKKFEHRIKKSASAKNHKVSMFEAVDLIAKNTIVKGRRKMFGRVDVSQTDKSGRLKPDSDLAIWLQGIRNKTICNLAVDKNLTKEKFYQAFADNIVGGYLELVSIDGLLKNGANRNNFGKKFNDIAKGKKLEISRDVLIGDAINLSLAFDTFKTRLKQKIEQTIDTIENIKDKAQNQILENKIISKLSDISQNFDKKCTNKWKNNYLELKGMVKTIKKQIGWGLAFNIAAHATGGVPIVAAISFACAGYQFSKDYITKRKEAKKSGKVLTLKKYCAQNKAQLASLALNGAVAVTSTLGISFSQNELMISSGIVATKCINKYRSSIKSGKSKIRAACGAGIVGLGAIISFGFAHGAGEIANSSGEVVDMSFTAHDKSDVSGTGRIKKTKLEKKTSEENDNKPLSVKEMVKKRMMNLLEDPN